MNMSIEKIDDGNVDNYGKDEGDTVNILCIGQ